MRFSCSIGLTVPPTASTPRYKAKVCAEVEAMKEQTHVMIDPLFSFGELRFQEVETARHVTEILDVLRTPAGRTAAWGRGRAGDRPRGRHRLHSECLAATGFACRRSSAARPARQRPQFESVAQGQECDRGEGDYVIISTTLNFLRRVSLLTSVGVPANLLKPIAPDGGHENSQALCRVWLVEDHAALRGLLESFFTLSTGFQLVGGSDSADPAIAAAEEGKIDLVVLDLLIPGRGGLLALQQLRHTARPPSVLIFSASASIHSLRLAVVYGASGYLEKSAPLEEVFTALRRIRAGGVHFGERPSQLLAAIMRSAAGPSSRLARQELLLLELMASGKSFKTIAAEMNVSPQKTYRVRKSLMRRCGALTTADLLRYMAKIGLNQSVGVGVGVITQ
ncbi:MAG: hypothetical protein RIQ93_1448 [Verrucomicrobiota bacterium]